MINAVITATSKNLEQSNDGRHVGTCAAAFRLFFLRVLVLLAAVVASRTENRLTASKLLQFSLKYSSLDDLMVV